MAELGIIAAVVQIADVGLRLSIKLYTFGEIVASADRSVISISKDVSLTSGVLKELGQILEKDRKSRTFSENAVQTADGVVKECLEVFQEMDSILVKKLPSLGASRREEKREERPKRAMVMLEKLKWGYLQPKLQLLRSNLDRLKSTLLLMLNVITYAKQVSERTESPSAIAEQRYLIEDLAHSNQEYIRSFEKLRLGIGGDVIENAQFISRAGAVETELSTKTEPVPPAPIRKFDSMKFAPLRTPLQDEGNTRGLGFNEPTTATRLSPNAQCGVTNLLATPPNADINDLLINTGGQSNITMPPLQVQGNPTTEVPLGFDQELLFKQLRYFSTLVQDLLEEVDEPRYKITFQSRLRMKGGIAALHEGERRELEKMWGCTALQKAEQRLDFSVEELGNFPTMKRSMPSVFSANDSSWLHSAAISDSEDSFAGDSDNWPSPFVTTDPPTQTIRAPPQKVMSRRACLKDARPRKVTRKRAPPEVASAKEERLQTEGAEAEGRAKNTTDSIGQSTDLPFVGYTKSQQFCFAEAGADMSLNLEHSETILKKDASLAVSNNGLEQNPAAALSGTGGSLIRGVKESYSLPYNSDLNNIDILENFDFEQYLQEDESKFDPSTFEWADYDMHQTALPVTESTDFIYECVEPGRTPDTFERESKQDGSQSVDMELVDHLVSLWTTLKL